MNDTTAEGQFCINRCPSLILELRRLKCHSHNLCCIVHIPDFVPFQGPEKEGDGKPSCFLLFSFVACVPCLTIGHWLVLLTPVVFIFSFEILSHVVSPPFCGMQYSILVESNRH